MARARNDSQRPGEEGLRFCMITTFYPPWHFGGDAIGTQRLARALVRRGASRNGHSQYRCPPDVERYRAYA